MKQVLLIMRLIIILITAGILHVSAASFGQKITLNEKNAKLTEVIKQIRIQSGYQFVYRSDLLDNSKAVTIKIKDASLDEALKQALQNAPFTYEIADGTVVIQPSEPAILEKLKASLQAIDVHGRIVDEKGQPLPGVTIKLKDESEVTSTDKDGNFVLKKVDEKSVIVISFIGYLTKEINATADIGTIALEISNSKLDEVQIMAYGVTSQRLSTGNISTVKAADIEKSPVANPLLAISGRIPGVFIQQSSGVPGSGVKVLIQGQNSYRNGNDPLYVIDGVPYASQLLPGLTSELGASGSGRDAESTQGNPLNFINPQDIESIDVLKDADATSIYGTRAANGAIIITTKKAKAGKTTVNFNLQQGGGRISRKVDLLNTEQYLTMRKEAFKNDNIDINTDPYNSDVFKAYLLPDLAVYDQNKYTDWQKELIGGTAKYTNLIGSISGGNSNTQFLVSGGYQREGTVTPGDLRDQKASVHFNLNNVSDNKKFKFNFSGNYVNDDNKLALVSELSLYAFTLPPNAPALRSSDGSLNWEYVPGTTYSSFNNPLANLEKSYLNRTSNLISNAVISYEIIPGLELKSTLGYNKLQSKEITTSPLSSFDPASRSLITRRSSFNDAEISTWIVEPQLTYIRNFGQGKMDFLLGSSIQQTDKDRQRLNAEGFTTDAAEFNIKAASKISVDNAGNAVILSKYKYNALFSRLNYNYADKYIASASIRRDGSSRFGSGNYFHNFWSLATAWLFSNESLLKKQSILSFGKFRASYGTTGNDQINDYAYLNLYGNTQVTGSTYQGVVGLQPLSNFPNPYLHWEETKKFSATVDLGIFKDRVLISATYFKNKTSNQLVNDPLVSITGGSSVFLNKPITVENSGIELSLNTVNLKSNSFKWTTTFNITVPKNKLVSYGDVDIDLKDDLIGKSLTTIKAFHYLGVDSKTGLYIFADKNGQPTSTPDPILDKTIYLNEDPRYYGGLQNSFTYHHLSLDVFFQFVKQNARNGFFGYSMPGADPYNQLTTVLDRWQQPGDVKTIQRFNTDYSANAAYSNAIQSDKAFSDASYVRLKNLSLSYYLPDSWSNKIKMKSARIYLQGQNLLTFSNYKGGDPENRTLQGLPPLKMMTLGVQVSL